MKYYLLGTIFLVNQLNIRPILLHEASYLRTTINLEVVQLYL